MGNMNFDTLRSSLIHRRVDRFVLVQALLSGALLKVACQGEHSGRQAPAARSPMCEPKTRGARSEKCTARITHLNLEAPADSADES